LGIVRIFSQLVSKPAPAYSLCEAFATCICLFIERVFSASTAGAGDRAAWQNNLLLSAKIGFALLAGKAEG
jgi:hypothetical protein